MLDRFEKSDQVLWAFTPNGILLHNFNRRQFIELTDLDAQMWAYCDGSRSPAEICGLLAINHKLDPEELDTRFQRVFSELLNWGFLVERKE